MSKPGRPIRVGVVGCGRAAAIHVGRLRAIDGVEIAGLADPDSTATEALLANVFAGVSEKPQVFRDHSQLLAGQSLDAVAIFTPHRAHFQPAIDSLQAGCHIFVEKPLSTNPQEADDIVRVAAARGLKVGVGHQYRLCGSLIEARRQIQADAIGPVRLVTATLAMPWLAQHTGPEDSWRLDPRISGGGILTDAGDHLLDALLWCTGRPAIDVAALQEQFAPGLDVVSAVALRLSGGILATLGVSGVAGHSLFEINFEGERGRIRVTDAEGWLSLSGSETRSLSISPTSSSIDSDFIEAIRENRSLCCPGDEALDTVRLTEAIGRSVASGQFTRVS